MKRFTFLIMAIAMLATTAFAGVQLEAKYEYQAVKSEQDSKVGTNTAKSKIGKLRLHYYGETAAKIGYGFKYNFLSTTNVKGIKEGFVTKEIMSGLTTKFGVYEADYVGIESDFYSKSTLRGSASPLGGALGFFYKWNMINAKLNITEAGTEKRGKLDYNLYLDAKFGMATVYASMNNWLDATTTKAVSQMMFGAKFSLMKMHKITATYGTRTAEKSASGIKTANTAKTYDTKTTGMSFEYEGTFGKFIPYAKYMTETLAYDVDNNTDTTMTFGLKVKPSKDNFVYYVGYSSTTDADDHANTDDTKYKDDVTTTMMVGMYHKFSVL